MRRLLPLVVLLAGCPGEDVTVTVVTVSARPAVHDAATLTVVLGNEDATLAHDFDVFGDAFPLDFTVETPERTGELTITAQALDGDGFEIGRGSGKATIVTDDESSASVLLDASDFVVNTAVAGAQKLAFFDSGGGRQIATDGDGKVLVGFTDDCSMLGRCDVYGRRFDSAGRPLVSAITADSDQFIANQSNVFGNDPAVVGSVDGGHLLVWVTLDGELMAVAVTAAGDHTPAGETQISFADDLPTQPSVAARPDGSYVVVWTEDAEGSAQRVVKARFLAPDGSLGDNATFVVSTTTTTEVHLPTVAVTDDGIIGFAWEDDGVINARFTNAAGELVPAAQVALVDYNVTHALWSPRLQAVGDEFYLLWSVKTAGGDFDTGALVGRRIAPSQGSATSPDSVLATGLPDTVSTPGLARRGDGALGVAWHACNANGDGAGCGIWLQTFRDNGLPVGPPLAVNTTTGGDQAIASLAGLPDAFAAAWNDDSSTAPDTSDIAVRARIVYPAFDDARGVIGADCGGAGDAPCGEALACLAASDDQPRCHAACNPGGPAPQCPRGGVCTTTGATSGCLF